jgi:hypothetical protein
MSFSDRISCLLSDDIWLPVLHVALVTLAIGSFSLDQYHRWRSSRPQHWSLGRARIDATLAVKRGPQSMAQFYGAYVALTGLFVAMALQVDWPKNHRVFFVVLDTVLIAYVCLWNSWYRNTLIRWTDLLSSKESR